MKILVSANFYIYLAILLLILPIQWLIAWITAVCFHEICHYVAVKICGGENYNLTLEFGGAVLSCSEMSTPKHIFSLLAGPIGGFLLVLLGRWFPHLALCSWVLSLYNLLPLQPLDGGQALRLMIWKEYTFQIIEKTILIILTFGCICLSIRWHLGILPIIIVSMLWMKNRNSPCKEQVCRVK